ncbi:MAG: hypothetical protein JWP66_1764 [Naasia sp.]|nr:hypothetical protein [Naasia sp.]
MTEPGRGAGHSRRIVTGPVGAWAAFAVVHVVLGAINLLDAVHLPFGDVVNVYRFWMDWARDTGVLVGIDTTWVYPVGALLPMGAAYLLGSEAYGVVWLAMVTALDALAFGALLRRSPAAAWWWVAFLAALGPIAVARLDAVTAPLAILGLLALERRPVVAGVLLALGAWIKVWPAAVLAAALVGVRRRLHLLAGALGLSAAILAAALVAGSGANVLGFVVEQGSRGLQVEAPVSALWLWQAVLGLAGSRIYYDTDILTYQVFGPGAFETAAVMTPLLVLAVAAVGLVAARGLRRGVEPGALLVPLTLALVTTLIVVNKVGSPQFVGWLAAPVILGLVAGQRALGAPAVPVLGIAVLTQIVYPWAYGPLIGADPLPAAVLTARNLGLVALLVLAVTALWRLPAAHSHPATTVPADPALTKET